MKNSKLLDKFKETVKEAKEGDLYNLDLWLKENGVNPPLLSLKRIKNYFIRNPDKIIGMEKKITIVAEYIGHILRDRENLFHFPVIGVTGSGKTLFLRIISEFTRSYDSNIVSLEKARNYEKYLEIGETPMRNVGRSVYLIDDCHKVKNPISIIEKLHKSYGKGVYITAWTPESWIRIQEELEDIIPSTNTFLLDPLGTEEIPHFLDNLIDSIMLPERINRGKEDYDSRFPDFLDPDYLYGTLSDSIEKYCKGIQSVSINFFLKCIEETFKVRFDKINAKIIETVAKAMGLIDLRKKLISLETLPDRQEKVLRRILIDTHREGTRPMDIVLETDLDKSTISYHLKMLKDDGFLDVKKEGKFSFYRVKNNLIPFIQLKILREIIG